MQSKSLVFFRVIGSTKWGKPQTPKNREFIFLLRSHLMTMLMTRMKHLWDLTNVTKLPLSFCLSLSLTLSLSHSLPLSLSASVPLCFFLQQCLSQSECPWVCSSLLYHDRQPQPHVLITIWSIVLDIRRSIVKIKFNKDPQKQSYHCLPIFCQSFVSPGMPISLRVPASCPVWIGLIVQKVIIQMNRRTG